QRQRSDRHKAAGVFGSPALDVADFIGEMKVLARHVPLAWLTLDASPTHSVRSPPRTVKFPAELLILGFLGDLSSFCIPLPTVFEQNLLAPWEYQAKPG